jgi:sigma-B regulation protein RsbU (phosphoserine phosphatase)
MRRLNTDLQDDFSKLGVFTTAFIGVWDNKTRILSFTNAGHSPIIYAPVGHEPQLLEAVDIPVGIVDKYPYSTQSKQLNSGDVFLIASDGLPEAHDASKNMYGYDRLRTALGQYREKSPRDICDALLNEVSAFCGYTPQADDQTLLVIKIK